MQLLCHTCHLPPLCSPSSSSPFSQRSVTLQLNFSLSLTHTHTHTHTHTTHSSSIMGHNLETRSLLDELKSFDKKGGLLDLGHPLLNRMAESFVKSAGIGAVHALSREAYFTAIEGPTPPGKKKRGFSELKGETNKKSVEALIKSTGKESLQWGLAAGMYSGITYGLKEARGVHDWKSSALAGALTGAALILTCDDSHDFVVQGAITGAALSTTANLLAGIF